MNTPLKQKFDFTLDEIRSWGGERQYLEALEQYANKGDVINVSYEDHVGEADISHAGHLIHTRFRTIPGKRSMVENLCPCASSQRDGRICVHMLAAAIGLVYKMRDEKEEAKRRSAERISAKTSLPEEPAAAPAEPASGEAGAESPLSRLAGSQPRLAQRAGRIATARRPQTVLPSDGRRIRYYVPENWLERFTSGTIPLIITIPDPAGKRKQYSLHQVHLREGELEDFQMTSEEDNQIFNLERMFPANMPAAKLPYLNLTRKNFFDFLKILGDSESSFTPLKNEPIIVRSEKNAVRSELVVDLNRASGQLDLSLHTTIPGAPKDVFPHFLVYRDDVSWQNDRIYALHDNNLWLLRTTIPATYNPIYCQRTYSLPRKETIGFIRKEISHEIPMVGKMKTLSEILGSDFTHHDVDETLFTIRPGSPTFSLVAKGSRASLSLSLQATYSGLPAIAPVIVTDAADSGEKTLEQERIHTETDITVDVMSSNASDQFTIPDPKDHFLYYTRNRAVETHAVKRLVEHGLAELDGEEKEDPAQNVYKIPQRVGNEQVITFLATTMPTLQRHNWTVELSDTLSEYRKTLTVVAPHITISTFSASPKFEISYHLASHDGSIEVRPEEMDAIYKLERERAKKVTDKNNSLVFPPISYIQRGDQTLIFDRTGIDELNRIIAECYGYGKREIERYHGTPLALDNNYAHFIKAAIDRLAASGIVIEKAPEEWRAAADLSSLRRNLKPAPLGEPVRSLLRPYQTTGVAWLRYLEAKGQGGILADEMGLGKTIQTLSWLSLPRISGSRDPALVVCPTSLVYNWIHEAKHFTPQIRVLAMTGAQRHEEFENIPRYGMVITSYALMRRDIEEYKKFRFSAVVLDEAQNIKNQNTLNARSVKELDRKAARLVVTGTPIENSVSDMYSIMDFLMPGYLGPYETFRRTYEEPMQQPQQSEAYQDASSHLHAKLAPFLLRRLKKQVAQDLPEKIVRASYSRLKDAQREVYERILEESRLEVTGSVRKVGFEKSRMLILTALLRLRQVCCHLSLVDEEAAGRTDAPSGKLEQLLQLLDEAMSQGHRILVFSQFVKMLGILREEFTRRKIPFCYLDGATRDRMQAVQRFNTDPSIPVFLISLKAGGTGLNLTGADEVVHFDPWWNPAVEDQATDRAHRIGQKHTVYSLRLIAQDTIEERVLEMQRRKRAIIDSTVEGDEQTMSKLTWADVKRLLDIE